MGCTHAECVCIHTRKARSPVGMIVFTVVMLGIPGGAFCLKQFSPHFAPLSSYVATSGTITGADVRMEPVRHRGPSMFVPAVKYTYTVNGVEHRCDRVQQSGPFFEQLNEAMAYGDGYRKVGSVQVWYNPKKPAQAVLLKTGAEPGRDVLLVLGAIGAMSVAMGWIAYAFRR